MVECDCVLSYRSKDTAACCAGIQSWGYNALVKTMLGLPMRTVNSAFKLYRRERADEPFRSSRTAGSSTRKCCTGSRAAATAFARFRCRSFEREAGTSKIGPSDILWILGELIKFRWSLMRDAPARAWRWRDMIDPDVELGAGVVIFDPQLVNIFGCSIGDDTFIGPFVEITRGVKIGRRCKIESHSFICDGVELADGVFIGHGVMFTNDLYPTTYRQVKRLSTSSVKARAWAATPP